MKMLAKGFAIADAASAAGFYDQAHFARHFKKLTGFTPGAFQAGKISGNN
jgi:AraC-like DNA-binding protein